VHALHAIVTSLRSEIASRVMLHVVASADAKVLRTLKFEQPLEIRGPYFWRQPGECSDPGI